MATETADEKAEREATAAKKAEAAERRDAAEQADQRADRYTRERLLGTDGPAITGAAFGEIAAALHDTKADTFTLAQVMRRIEAYRGHEDTTGQET